MPNKKITELPNATLPIVTGTKFEAVQGGVNVQVDADDMPGSGAAGVASVNGDTGPAVVLDATDVGADPAGSASTVNTALSNHISDATDAHAGTAITNTPAGNIAATTVQAAINELDSEKANLASPAFTGTPTSPTPATGTSNTQVATAAYVISSASQIYRVSLPNSSTIYHYGDSYSTGSGASGATKDWTTTLNETLSTTEDNNAISGTGVFSAAGEIFSNNVIGSVFPGAVLIGLNDLFRSYDAATLEKIKGGHRAIIATHFSSAAIPANSGSVSTSGTWTTITAGTYKDRASLALSGLGRQSTVSGSTLTYTSTGSSLVVGCWGADVSAFDDGRFTVTVDGTLRATFDPAGKSKNISPTLGEGRSQNAVILFGLGGGTHTVVITTLDNKPTLIDYIGTLVSPNNATSFLVGGPMKILATEYTRAFTTYGTVIDDTAFDTADDAIKSVVSEFPNYPVVWVNTNKYVTNKLNSFVSLDLHPNDLGHAQIAQAFADAVGSFRVQGVFTTPVQFPNGTVSTVGLRSTYAANDGIYAPASGQLAFALGGVESLKLVGGNASMSSATALGTGSGGGFLGTTTHDPSAADQRMGFLLFGSTGANIANNAGIFSYSAEDWTGSAKGQYLSFATTSATTTTRTVRMTLAANGSLFVGGTTTTPHSTLTLGGSFATPYVAKTALYTLTAADYTIEVTSGTHTQTLPTAVGIAGRQYVITNSGSGTVTVGTTSSQTFVNVTATPTTLTLAQFDTAIVQSNGTNWLRLK